ncbi:hypothetical protein DSECCO2_555240 [anaerobic digester metagenome]
MKKALKIDPENSIYLASMAYSQKSAGFIEQAIKYYELSLKHNPEDISTYLDLSALYDEQQNYREALDIVDSALQRFVDEHELICRKVVYLIRLKQYTTLDEFIFAHLETIRDNQHLIYDYDPALEEDAILLDILK